ncbi:50S ribosomal protein L4 [PVC group bacterium (ex Bugula neritina AB1)]|nr:50S ribosomal protein L4 [PVC group bacterium (ex Bugula neritina AB1)]
MSVVTVIDQKGEKVKEITFSLLEGEVRKSLVHECIRYYRAAQRQGNACTKTRGEVTGSGAKPWKQKGSGQARAGTKKSPIWRGGGVVFGPKPRSYRFAMPKKKRKLALLSLLRSRYQEESLLVIDELKFESVATKNVQATLNDLKLSSHVLFVTSGKDENFLKMTSNLENIGVKESAIVNAFDVIKYKNIVCTEKAFQDLENRLQNKEAV